MAEEEVKQKKKMPRWKKWIIGLLVTILVISSILVGGYFFVREKYEIDILKVLRQLKTLSRPVDENEICPNKFNIRTDMVDVQTEVNKSVEGMISYSEEAGYSVEFEDLPDEMKQIISLTDKQVGALAQTIVQQEMEGKINIDVAELPIDIKQVEFSNLKEDGSATLNIVIRLDIRPLKDMIGGFPINLLKSRISNYLYVSSTVDVVKNAEPFKYDIIHNSFTVNNLDAENTEDLFKTLDKILKIGSAESLNVKIGETVMQSLVGDDYHNGLAYSLKDLGVVSAKDFAFKLNSKGEESFVVLRKEI